VTANDRLGARAFLQGARLIAARDLGATFDTGVGFVYAIAFALLANGIFMNGFFLQGVLDMRGYFELLPLLLAFFLPAISMRLWAEERKARTVELLLTLPIRTGQAVLGKFLAGLGLYAAFLATSLPIPVLLCALGEPDLGAIAAGYAGLLGFGALFLAFGGFLSALSRDQIVAFSTATLLGFLLVLSGNASVVAILDGLFPRLDLGSLLYDTVSVMPHYAAFVAGTIRLSAALYFALASALFLWCTALALDRLRT
jgi:ABC-type transport system involved in multi-copper enzyme maturation permease subunit